MSNLRKKDAALNNGKGNRCPYKLDWEASRGSERVREGKDGKTGLLKNRGHNDGKKLTTLYASCVACRESNARASNPKRGGGHVR